MFMYSCNEAVVMLKPAVGIGLGVVVADDIGEGVHAFGGFVGQLVDLGFDVFGGLFGGHEWFVPTIWPRGARARAPRAHVIQQRSSDRGFTVSRDSILFRTLRARRQRAAAIVLIGPG